MEFRVSPLRPVSSCARGRRLGQRGFDPAAPARSYGDWLARAHRNPPGRGSVAGVRSGISGDRALDPWACGRRTARGQSWSPGAGRCRGPPPFSVWDLEIAVAELFGNSRSQQLAGGNNKATAHQSPWLKRRFPKSPLPTNVYASAIGLCKDSCLIAKEKCSVSRQPDGSPLGSLLSTRSTRWSPRARDPRRIGPMFGCRLR